MLYADIPSSDRAAIVAALDDDEISCGWVDGVADLLKALTNGEGDVLVVSEKFPRTTEESWLAVCQLSWPDLPVIWIASTPEQAVIVDSLDAGALDVVDGDAGVDELRLGVGKALRWLERAEEQPPVSRVHHTAPNDAIVGRSPVLLAALDIVERAARTDSTVIIRGESGTGKELIAERIHQKSDRASGPFVKVHCGALPEQLLESELFGYEKGAFTGAARRKAGRVELADGGTLFLDEIGDISASTQVKLLRILQDREYELLGGVSTHKADVRFVAATHRNLEAMVAKGEFREDLFCRLNVIRIVSPSLRDRDGDIALLAEHFLRSVGAQNSRPNIALAPDALKLLQAYRWPGNVRQLSNAIERLVVLSDQDLISAEFLRSELSEVVEAGDGANVALMSVGEVSMNSTVVELGEVVARAEKRALSKALQRAKGNKTLAARILGVSRRTLYNKLAEHGLA